MTKVFFRVDGNNQIGWGHIIRSFALYEMLKEKFDCYFILKESSPAIINYLKDSSVKLKIIPSEKNLLEEAHYIANELLTHQELELIVLDGYHFNFSYQEIIKKKCLKLICIDDLQIDRLAADVIINHSGGVSPLSYSTQKNTFFCFGLDYALLRKPFLEEAKKKQNYSFNKNIFICLGASDPNNYLLELLTSLNGQLDKSFTLFIIVSNDYAELSKLEKIKKESNCSIQILKNLKDLELLEVMKKCSIGICSPSTVAMEYLCTSGILFLQLTAANQESMYDFYLENRFAYSLKALPTLLDEATLRTFMPIKKAIDGNSPQRYIDLFTRLSEKC